MQDSGVGVRQSTIITLGASVAFGVFAVFLARGWINDAIRDEYSRRGPTQAEQTSQSFETVPVVVVNTDVSFGDVLSTDLLKIVDFPVEAVPVGVYESMNTIFVDPSQNTVVLRHMARNEPVLDYKIMGPGAKGSMSALISEGMRAVSVRVNEVAGVAGFIMPGDLVDVIYTRDDTTRRNGNNLKSDILLQNVKVLGIDQDLNDMKSTPSVAKTVTLEVTNVDAQKLHLAQDAGKLSMTLRRAGDTELDTPKTIGQSTLLNTRSGYAASNRGTTRPVVTAAQPKTSSVANVTIIRGEKRDQVEVIKHKDNNVGDTTSLAGG